MSEYISPGKKSWFTKLAKQEAAKNSTSNTLLTEGINAIPMPVITTSFPQAKNVPLNKYYYNKDLDIYVTHIKSNPEPLFVTGEKHLTGVERKQLLQRFALNTISPKSYSWNIKLFMVGLIVKISLLKKRF
jgi:hypothetical protein